MAMTPEAIDYMTEHEVLFLDKSRRKKHFEPATVFKFATLIPAGLFIYFFVTYKEENWLLTFQIFGAMAFCLFVAGQLIYLLQRRKLKLDTFETQLPKAENETLVRKTLEILQWPIDENSPDFIEAHNPHLDCIAR